MSKYYMTNGTEISRECFIETFNKEYFWGNAKSVPRISQNSRFAEEYIERILRYGIKEPVDVYRIMAWKVGKIRHADTDTNQSLVYASNWIDAEKGVVRNYRYQLDMRSFAEGIVSNIEMLEKMAKNDPQGVLQNLKDGVVRAPNGIGTVYLLTLLYFISRGKWPIYDRFAMMALLAIEAGKKPGEQVSFSDLPEKNSEDFNAVMNLCKQRYISKLEMIFGKNYNDNRDVDRALWVYGHLFKRI